MTYKLTHKLLVSSLALANLIEGNSAMRLQCTGGALCLGNKVIIVECRTAFEHEMDDEQRNRILRVMRALGEQPVLLTFKGAGDFVQLDQVLL